jgi:mono/diheme cytochrome c family protein
MRSPRARRVGRTLFALVVSLLSGTLGCWEQWSNDWFPQMKWQPSVQAFERPMHDGRVDPFSPPEGTVPAQGFEPPVSTVDDAQANALANPRPMSVASLENGRRRYETYCSPCHGVSGRGDGPVSLTGPLQGPIAAVLPISGPGSIARVRSDGHIYTTIRYGRRRMPNYWRISSDDRWDIVNWIRYLDGQKGVAQ